MSNATLQKWEGRWEQFKGRAKILWGDLTRDELLQAEGDCQLRVGEVKAEKGKRLEELERRILKE